MFCECGVPSQDNHTCTGVKISYSESRLEGIVWSPSRSLLRLQDPILVPLPSSMSVSPASDYIFEAEGIDMDPYLFDPDAPESATKAEAAGDVAEGAAGGGNDHRLGHSTGARHILYGARVLYV